MKAMSMRAWLFGLLTVASVQTSEAQFSHVDGVIDRIESHFQELSGGPLTPESAREVHPETLQNNVLRPLRWEQRKIRMRLDLLEKSLFDNRKAQERVLGESLDLGRQLSEKGIFSEEDLDRAVTALHELRAKRVAAEAERNALEEAIANEQLEAGQVIELEQAKLELETQHRVLKTMEEKVKRMRELHKDGTISNAALAEVTIELERQSAQVRLAELEVEKMISGVAREARKPLQRVAQEVVMLKQQMNRLQERVDLQNELREILRRKRDLAIQHERLVAMGSRLLTQQAEWELELAYLDQVLATYSDTTAPEAVEPREKAESEVAPDGGN